MKKILKKFKTIIDYDYGEIVVYKW